MFCKIYFERLVIITLKRITKNEQKEDYMLSLDGNGEAMVLGCLSVLNYTESEICLSLKKNILTIRGERLCMTSYYPSDMRISGKINEILIGKR